MDFADRTKGNDEIIRRLTNSFLRLTRLCIHKGGGHCEP